MGGLVWGDDPLQADNVYKGNLLFYVPMYDHMTQRGYVRNIPGAPMCACAEICQSSLALTAPKLRLRRQPPFHGTVARSRQVCEFATSTSTRAMARMSIIIFRSVPSNLKRKVN